MFILTTITAVIPKVWAAAPWWTLLVLQLGWQRSFCSRPICCVSIQGLHPSWDSLAFGAFPGCVTRCFTLMSWFLPPRPSKSDDLRHAMSPFSLFLSSFVQRILGYVRPQRIVAVHPPWREKRRIIWRSLQSGTAFVLCCDVIGLQMLLQRTLNWVTAIVWESLSFFILGWFSKIPQDWLQGGWADWLLTEEWKQLGAFPSQPVTVGWHYFCEGLRDPQSESASGSLRTSFPFGPDSWAACIFLVRKLRFFGNPFKIQSPIYHQSDILFPWGW